MATPSARAAVLRQRLAARLRAPGPRPQRRLHSTGPPPPSEPPAPPSVWRRGLDPLARLAGTYGRTQRRRPWATQLVGSLCIFFIGDISAQRMSGKDYDARRTARSLVIGGLASIPNFQWFVFLQNHFNFSSKILSIATKVAVNQACFTPVFNTYFFGMQALLAGDGLAATWERVTRTVPTSVANSLKLWPAVTALNLWLVPLEFRALVAGVVAVGWQTYLSLLNRRAEMAEAAEKQRQPVAATAASAVVPAIPGDKERMAA